jgi:hypothetical protein
MMTLPQFGGNFEQSKPAVGSGHLPSIYQAYTFASLLVPPPDLKSEFSRTDLLQLDCGVGFPYEKCIPRESVDIASSERDFVVL